MTLTSPTVRNTYNGSGSAGPFPYAFKITTETDLAVYRTDANGIVTRHVYPADYSVAGAGNAAGGSITLTTALATGQSVAIVRATPATQPTSLRSLGTFLPESHEDALDRLTMIAQQNEDAIGRSIRLDPSIDPAVVSTALVPETGKALVWQDSATLGNSTLDGGAIAIPGDGRTVSSFSAYVANNKVWNVLDFGALGNGVHDDAPAIQGVIGRAGSDDSIFFPDGYNYHLGSGLTVTGKTRLTFRGEGWGSVITQSAATFDMIAIDSTSVAPVVRDLQFVGVSVGADNFCAVRSAAVRTTIRDCEVSNVNAGFLVSIGTWYTGMEHHLIAQNYVHDIPGSTSGHGYGTYSDAPNTIFANNRYKNVGRHDIYCSGSSPIGANHSVVIGNTSIGNGVEAIAVFQAAGSPVIVGVVVSQNTIKDPLGIGIGFDANVHGCAIVNNTISGSPNGFAPIRLDGDVASGGQPSGNIIANNTILNNGHTQGILLTNACRTVITGNTVDATTYGIFVTSQGSPAEFPTGNIVDKNIMTSVSGLGVYIDATCVMTVVGQNVSPTGIPDSIGNDRNVVVSTDATSSQTVDLTGRGGGVPIFVRFEQAGTITVTNFTGCREGQVLHLLFGTSQVTVTQANAFLNGSASFVSTIHDTLTLILRGTNWNELARSVN